MYRGGDTRFKVYISCNRWSWIFMEVDLFLGQEEFIIVLSEGLMGGHENLEEKKKKTEGVCFLEASDILFWPFNIYFLKLAVCLRIITANLQWNTGSYIPLTGLMMLSTFTVQCFNYQIQCPAETSCSFTLRSLTNQVWQQNRHKRLFPIITLNIKPRRGVQRKFARSRNLLKLN